MVRGSIMGDSSAVPPLASDNPPDDVAAREAEHLRAEISRGQALDRELAQRLGRPEPRRLRGAGDYFGTLARRPALSEADERRLLDAARAGDPVARAQVVESYMPLVSA